MDQQALFDDFKQFMIATISQQTAELTARMDRMETAMTTKDDLAKLDRKLSNQITELQASVAEALSTSNDAVDEQLTNHEQRLRKLEARTV